MQPIPKQRIDNSAYEQLLGNIKRGTWKPGEKLPSESELCAILQVSRVSIRSALQKLQALGFIEVKRAKGSFVCGSKELFDSPEFDSAIVMTPQDLQDIAELRSMVEEKSVELLLAKNGPVDLSKVTQAYQGMVAAVRDLDLDAFTLYDHQFHQAVILATGNRIFIQIAQIFRDDFFRYLQESNRYLGDIQDRAALRGQFEQILVWHTELYTALSNLDPAALDEQKRHIARNSERLRRFRERSRQDGDEGR